MMVSFGLNITLYIYKVFKCSCSVHFDWLLTELGFTGHLQRNATQLVGSPLSGGIAGATSTFR